jgi:hypothetical protein
MYGTCGHDEQTVNAHRLTTGNFVKSGCTEDCAGDAKVTQKRISRNQDVMDVTGLKWLRIVFHFRIRYYGR